MEVLTLAAQINDTDGRKRVLWHALQGHEGDSLIYDFLTLFLGEVTIAVPDHATCLEPLGLHCLEGIVIEVLQDLAHGLFLSIICKKIRVKFSIGQSENLIQIVVLPELSQLLLDLVEDLTAVFVSHGTDFLDSLSDEVDQRVIESAPAQIDVVARRCNGERELSAVGHVGKLT